MNRATIGRFSYLAVLWVAGSMALALVTWGCFRLGLNDTTVALLYLIVIVLLTALLNSFISSVFFSVVAVGCLDFFFFNPIFSLEVSDPRDLVALVAFLSASLVVTGLVRRLRQLGEIQREQTRLLDLTTQNTYLAEAQQLSHTGSFGWDVASGEIFWSEESFRIFQYDPQIKPTLELVFQRVHPDDAALVQKVVSRAASERQNFDFEHRLLLPDGSVRHLHIVAHAATGDGGNLQFMGALMDITARKRDEEAQKELRAALNNAPVAVWSSSSNGLSDFANESWLKYLNLSEREIQGFGWAAALHPDDAPSHLATWRESAANGATFRHESRFRRFDGEYRWFLIQAVPHHDQDGNIVKWHGTCIDIEDRKRSERAVQDSEQRYRHLFHHVPIALVRLSTHELTELFGKLRAEGVTDLSAYLDQHPEFLRRAMDALVIEEVNEQAIKTLGAQNREQLLGPGTRFWGSRPETFRRSIESRFGGSLTFEEETKLVTLDGREIDVLFTAARLGSMGERMSIVGIVDVTERVRAQEMLQQVQAEFAHAARISVLGELAASIAHEVNQPLAAIRTNSETGLRWLDRAEPNIGKARELMQRNVDDARRAADIITRIRTMAAGRRPQQTGLPLHEVIEESIVFLRNELQSKGVSISLDLAPALPQVTGDRIQLQQVIVNLAINAVQAMAQSAAPRRTLFIRTGLSDAGVSCTVEDSGPGIDPPHLNRLFDSFFTTKDAGMGMGLPVSRSIIEAHGGQLRADNNSTLGGARFSFVLPVNEAAAE
jgi:PAS domain S-box-containing protein